MEEKTFGGKALLPWNDTTERPFQVTQQVAKVIASNRDAQQNAEKSCSTGIFDDN